MDRKHEAFSFTCHNFSDIRRRPLVIGKLDQVRLPFVVTMPQLAVGAITFALLFATRPAWGAVMSDRLHIVMFVVVPILVAQQVSRTSIEGRTVSKAALGFLRLWLAPADGEINGRRRGAVASSQVVIAPLVPRPASATPTTRIQTRSRETSSQESVSPDTRSRRTGSPHAMSRPTSSPETSSPHTSRRTESRRTRARRAREAAQVDGRTDNRTNRRRRS